MNLNHAQFSYELNRSRNAPVYPPHYDWVPQPNADKEHPYLNTHVGLFDGCLTDEKGNERPYVLYVPSTMKTSGNSMIVFIPGKTCPREFFKKSCWKESLEKHAVSALFLSAPDGWNHDDPGMEVELGAQALGRLRANEYFYYNAPGVYAMGFEDGAKIAGVFSALYVSVLAAWAAYGDTDMDGALMDLIANSPSDCDKTLTKIQVPLPAFIVDDKNSTQVEYFKKACYVKDEYLFNGFARVYRQQPKIGESYINEQAVAEVWHSENAFAQKLGMDVIVEKMVAFVEGYKRWGGEGNHYLRRTQLPEDIGLILNEKEIDGRIRRWHMFEPSAYKKGLKEKYPLVIAIHGFSCSGPFFAENSGWHAVAESRGFLLVYPTAYPNEPAYSSTRMGEKRNLTATPEWNSSGLNPSPNAPDEISFYKQMVAEIEKNYPVDPERIYVTGHSNGSMMTQKLMRFWPEKFAGFAPVGAMECRRGNLEAPTDGVKRNVWYTIGEFDGEGISLEGDNGNTRTLKMICQANGLEYDLSRRYSTGIYNTVTIRDAEKVPMVRFTGVTNWPHTYSPELAFMIYDEFFAQFIRKEDGELVYLA